MTAGVVIKYQNTQLQRLKKKKKPPKNKKQNIYIKQYTKMCKFFGGSPLSSHKETNNTSRTRLWKRKGKERNKVQLSL